MFHFQQATRFIYKKVRVNITTQKPSHSQKKTPVDTEQALLVELVLRTVIRLFGQQ